MSPETGKLDKWSLSIAAEVKLRGSDKTGMAVVAW
jgi:hypothetical protein